MTPLQETTNNQRLAAAPERSAFVMANAGSGKTRVLANRVARLLLDDTPPQKILCITFTKAAAAEMAERLFEMLGEWALADDATLLNALKELEGEDTIKRDAGALATVRRLFARALETPGGLKIQTIHSFCESVLRRFPLEAGAPPGFTVIEDSDAGRLVDAAIDRIGRRALREPVLGDAVAQLAECFGEQQLRNLLTFAAKQPVGNEADAAAGLTRTLNIDPKENSDDIIARFINALSAPDLERAQAALSASGGIPAKLAAPVGVYLNAASLHEKWQALSALFLTQAGSPRKQLATKATDTIDPWAGPYLNERKEEFLQVLERIKSLTIYLETTAFLEVRKEIQKEYGAAKAARAGLDFNDLILKTHTLFKQSSSAWIMYKLDHGIDHILIDEAQDTSPEQWAVVESLFEEFLSGAGARESNRSFFAVGDMKQSIYSFQGADAGLFKEKEHDLGKRLSAAAQYQNVPLTLSFRTAEPVLSFVDALFNDPEAAEGLGEFPVPNHGVYRSKAAGLVEVWPLCPRPEKPASNPWDAPVDEPAEDHPVRALSARITQTVNGWLNNQTILESQGRPIAPGDIMILVQSRGPLFDEIIRQLARAGVPIAGADRLKLLHDPAVEDLLSFAKTVLYTEDNLSLAETLKSPLFEFDDDADLFPLAHNRPKGLSLWQALHQRRNEKPAWRAASERLAEARTVALHQGPFAFLTHILEMGAPSGRSQFYERLTESSREAVDETLRQTLDFENANPRSLRAFLSWFEETAGDIKREMDRVSGAVRVMTVHGAKGLEANIVFLVDAHRGPQLSQGPLFDLEPEPPAGGGRRKLPVLVSAKDLHIETTDQSRKATHREDYEEYRRLLYVAATRARDRLYICGHELGNDKKPRAKQTGVKTWHSLAEDAFDRLGPRIEVEETPYWDKTDAPLRRLSSKQKAPVQEKFKAASIEKIAIPSWLHENATPEKAALRIAPSRLAGEEGASPPVAPSDAAYSPVNNEDRYFRGRVLHRLLELLPDIEKAARHEAADTLLARLAPETPEAERSQWRNETLSILNDKKFSAVFGPGSRAEVSIAGAPRCASNLYISGQIDRLIIGEAEVLIVDYKTNRPPPADVKDADPAYVAQLAAYRALLQEIYPGHQIQSALLWTYDARLTPVPDALLDHAFARIRAAG